MSVIIPSLRVRSFALVPRLFSGEQEGALGGPDLPIARMGDRWSANVATAQLRQDAASSALVAALTVATTDGARMAISQPHVPQLPASAPVVDGVNQAGSAIAIRGVPANTLFQVERYISILHLGVHHVHMVTAAVTTPTTGRVTLSIWPMLRFLTLDGERVHISDPMIEGRLVGFDAGAAFVRNRREPVGFSIVERS